MAPYSHCLGIVLQRLRIKVTLGAGASSRPLQKLGKFTALPAQAGDLFFPGVQDLGFRPETLRLGVEKWEVVLKISSLSIA